jgi:ketosteroid isomerase-like protein
MTTATIAAVRRMYDGFARGDLGAVLATLDPAVEWNEAEGFIYDVGRPLVGPAEVRSGVFERLAADWEWFTVTPRELLDAGDTVVAHGYYAGKLRKNGRTVRAQFAHLFTFDDGRVVRFQQYTDTAQFALAVADPASTEVASCRP